MSHLLDRLRYFKKVESTFSKGYGIVTNEDRQWEDIYRNRWRHDKVVRSTHGVNCTGGCGRCPPIAGLRWSRCRDPWRRCSPPS